MASGKIPDVVMWSERDYGNRVGVWRMMEVLDRYGIRATVALNSLVCDHHPVIIEEGRQRQWEWMGHNESNTRRLNEAPPARKREIIRRTFANLDAPPVPRPRGGSAPACRKPGGRLTCLPPRRSYVCDWCNDDQPYLMQLEAGRCLVVGALCAADQRQARL